MFKRRTRGTSTPTRIGAPPFAAKLPEAWARIGGEDGSRSASPTTYTSAPRTRCRPDAIFLTNYQP